MIRESLFLFFFTMLTLNAAAFANKCTEAAFSMNANPNLRIDPNIYVDSVYTKSSTQKYIYTNGKVTEVREKGEKEQILYFYPDADKSSLKNTGTEYILTKCEAKDTLCYVQSIYQDGVLFDGTLTIKATPDYISQEIEQPDYHQLTEFILKPDTLISKDESYGRQMGYKVNSKSSTMLYVADPNDDTKCYLYANEKNYATLSYNPNEKGFSISMTIGNLDHPSAEYFFIDANKTSSLRKAVKPVKMLPKARYFDLLGRYKFTK
jgi:hypothetical protein